MDKNDHLYRPCVGICLLNDDHKIFVGSRIDTKEQAWQMPQGGIDEGEDVQTAALRELKEETYISSIKILNISDQWITYDFPNEIQKKSWGGKYKGQKQKWLLARFRGQESEINLNTEHPEFKAYQWMSPKEIINHIVPFKKELYIKIFNHFNLLD